MKAPAATVERRNGADVVRGIGALLLLAVLLAGVPYVLYAIAGLPFPRSLPSWDEVSAALLQPDDGRLLLRVLAVTAWAGWAAFALSVAVELLAHLRGQQAPRLPALALPQRAAGALVASVAVLFLTPTIAVSGPLRPAAATPLATVAASAVEQDVGAHEEHRDTHQPSEPEDRQAPAERAAQIPGKTYIVCRGDSLWAIAERHLGDGERFVEIAALNYGVAQPDGRTLTRSHWVRPGWRLHMPPDAVGLAAPVAASSRAASAAPLHMVKEGDTLWDIAEERLGSGERFAEIVALNRDRVQSDGERLTDPDHIEPDWLLELPASRRTSTSQREAPEVGAPLVESRAASPVPAPSSPVTPTHSSSTAHTDRSVPAVEDETSPPSVAPWALGLTGVAAAGVIATLSRRRARQQRTRRPGRRIRMPDQQLREAESELRAAHDSRDVDRLVLGLRQLGAECAALGQPLPAVAAIRLRATGLELLFDHDEPTAISPFVAATPRAWQLNDDGSTPRQDVNSNDGALPYSALVTLGRDHEGLVLLNLETAGLIAFLGCEEAARELLLALALELATSKLTEQSTVTLVGFGERLIAGVDAGRLHHAQNLDSALPGLHRHAASVADVLKASGAGSILEARPLQAAADAHAPELVLIAQQPTLGQLQQLQRLTARPAHGIAALLQWQDEDVPVSDWMLRLREDGALELPRLGLVVEPQRLTAENAARLAEILRVASTTADVARAVSTFHTDDVPRLAVPPSLRAADPGRADQMACPGVRVLGPVDVTGAAGDAVEPSRRRRLVELAAFIALHPGADNHSIDEAIWPSRRVSQATRNSATSRLRRWLGRTANGEPYLPLVPDGAGYRFHPAVRSDWQDFQDLARSGFAVGPDGCYQLAAALDLVRGRPFAGVDPASYTWAEADAQEMISAITDVAHALSVARLAAGDAAGARAAVAKGLLAEPCSELLYRDAIRAAGERGDIDEVKTLADRLRVQLEQLDPDEGMDGETAALIEGILRGPH